jgi:hypothetical protein
MSARERFEDALRDHGCAVTNGKAQCPVADHGKGRGDLNPSLWIDDRRDGMGAVIKCLAGCETTDVVAALRLTMADLFDNRPGFDPWSPTRDYHYPKGRVVHRKRDKSFPQSGNTKDDSLFHANDLIEIDAIDTIYVPEGEKDVEAIELAGGQAVCPPMGAGQKNLDRYDWSVLKGKHVIIVTDKDKGGRYHAERVASILDPIAESVKIVEAAEGKDAADHIAAGKGLDELVDVPSPLLAGLKSAADLENMTFNPLVEHVPSLIVEGFGILAGAPKVGKSWLALGIALACAQGGKAFGTITVEPRAVLLLALEDGERRLQSRMFKLNGDDPLPANLTYLTKVAPGTVAATISAWLKVHRRDQSPPLVILDTLGKARPQRKPGEDAYIADYQLGTWIKNTVDAVPGAALLAVHHIRKMGATDWLDTVAGTNGLTGSADYIVVLTRKRKSGEGLLSVTGRDIRENEYATILSGEGIWKLDGGSFGTAVEAAETRRESERLGDRALEVLGFVNSRLVPTCAADVAKDLDIDQHQARTYLGRLADSGRIRKLGRGLYSGVAYVATVAKAEENATENTHATHTFDQERLICPHCGDVLMHPESIARGYCAKPKCLLEEEKNTDE